MIVLDTTVLLYAVGVAHPYDEACRELIAAAGEGRVRCTTTVEVIQEFTHVRARRRDRADAAAFARWYLALLSPLLVVGDEEVRDGLRLFERHAELGAFDAVLAAAARAAEAEALVSADRAFSAVRGLKHLVPGTAEMSQLVGG